MFFRREEAITNSVAFPVAVGLARFGPVFRRGTDPRGDPFAEDFHPHFERRSSCGRVF
jgi:hypothetical protein